MSNSGYQLLTDWESKRANRTQYADDCQFYLCTPVSQAAAAVSKLSECLTDIHNWLSSSRLRLNPSKTRAMWLGSGQQLDKIDIREVSTMSTRVSVNTPSETLVSFSTADSLGPTMSLPYVALATTNCVSSAQWYVLCQLMAPRQWSMPSFRAGLITATRYLLAPPIARFVYYSRSRMRPPVLLPALLDVNTLRRYSGIFIGCQYVSGFGTSWQPWHSDHYQARRRRRRLPACS